MLLISESAGATIASRQPSRSDTELTNNVRAQSVVRVVDDRESCLCVPSQFRTRRDLLQKGTRVLEDEESLCHRQACYVRSFCYVPPHTK